MIARIVMAAMLALFGGLPVLAEEDLASLNQRGEQLEAQGKLSESTAIAEQALALAERTFGAEHPDTLLSAFTLAKVYAFQGRFSDAEPLFRRALAGAERAFGAEHGNTISAVSHLAGLYQAQGRYGAAEPLFQRVLASSERTFGADHIDTLHSIGDLASLYQAQERWSEAEALFRRALAGAERTLGADHIDALRILAGLATLYQRQGRWSEAEALFRRVLESAERTLGADHLDTLQIVGNLASLYQRQGRYGDAEPLFERTLSNAERTLGADHSFTLQSVSDLAGLYQTQGRHGDAEALFLRSLAGAERTLGAEHPDTLRRVRDLAALYHDQGRYSDAEPLYRRTLASRERTLGAEHPETLRSVADLALLHNAQARYSEAEPFLRRALSGRERHLGPEHPETLRSIVDLGWLYQEQGRHSDAEPLHRRALAGNEHALGAEHPDTLSSVNNLAWFYQTQGRYDEAEPLYRRALAGRERLLGPEHRDTLRSANDLASLYALRGRYSEAEPLHRRALAGAERAFGPAHLDTLISVDRLASLYSAQGHYSEAEPLFRRAMAGSERLLGPDHPSTLHSTNNLATMYFAQGDWTRAAELWRRGTASAARRMQRGTLDTGQSLTGKKETEVERSSSQFQGLVRATYHLAPDGGAPDAATSREMFQMAQSAISSEAAQSMAQMAARGAKGDWALAALIRERQDLLAEWRKRELLQNAAFAREAAKRNAKAEAENTIRMAAIDKRLATEFADYAALASPAPLSTQDVQAQLGSDEALILFMDTAIVKPTPEESFIWVVTRTDARWLRSDLGTAALTREVQALRCGLDEEEWATPTRSVRCMDLLGMTETPDPSQPLPFDLTRAHRLYEALFGQAKDLIKDKHLLLVPSGPLTQLPFQVLLTAPPAGRDYKAAAWLTRDHAISVLPAVSSIKALRRTGRPSAAAKPFIGFGNPLLDGPDRRYADNAKLARENESCPKSPTRRTASIVGLRNGVRPIATRGGVANVSFVRELAPLPETADEVCAVASDVGADADDIHLGGRATERDVKAISESGELAKYRIVHFATHGAMAGQFGDGIEPGLILTPPAKASPEDDGYLSASEIASLKLDADWVILSACNTAAGDSSDADALSGIARAFIYAQTRALLVSHWAVNSNTTVKLIIAAMREIARDKTVGRAEALRRSMLALIDNGDPDEAHPAYWAPFIVVGEGAHY